MSDGDDLRAGEVPPVTEVAAKVLSDLESKYNTVRCPIHDVPPQFDVDEAGGVVEHICCEALAQIFRELKAQEAREAPEEPRSAE